MNLIVEFCIVFLICMAGEWIAALLPFTLPASVISLILLLILLLSGGVKERTIQGTSHFLIDNMGLFFIPSVVGTLEYLDVLKLQLVPFLVVSTLRVSLGFGASSRLAGLMTPLFRQPGSAGTALVLGLVGGYPIGARTEADLNSQGQLTED